MIAADLSPGSLEKAKEKSIRYGLQEQMDCRLSDGLSEISPGETDAIIISGMGGILMDRILRNGIDVVRASKELILSPHRDVPLIKAFAEEFGFEITDEVELEEKGKKYTILNIRICP